MMISFFSFGTMMLYVHEPDISMQSYNSLHNY